MKLRITLAIILFTYTIFASYSQKQNNYGTADTEVLVVHANDLFKKGKLEEAKVLYQQALATGDKYFEKKCTDQLKIINNMLAGKKSNNTIFTVSQDTVFINYLGGDYPIHVSGTNWSASTSGSEDWCKIEVNRKKGLIMIATSPNNTTEDRGTVITVKNGNGQKKTVKVTNGASPEILRSSAQSLVFTPSGETNIVDIDANTTWNITDVPEWLNAIKGVGDIQFTASANDENKDRIAQVKVETPSKNEITINIIQGAALDSLTFSKNDLHFGPDGGDEYVKVLTDADDWRFGDFPHWCQLTRIDDNMILVHCTPNEPVEMPREASVNVTNGTQTLGINVFQDPKPIVHLIPVDGIGGRRISFGFAAGFISSMISANSSSEYQFSPVNYALANNKEQVSYKSVGGFSIEAFVDYRAYKNLYLTVGIDFTHYKYKNELSGTIPVTSQQHPNVIRKGDALASFKEDYKMTTLDIPILASYRIPITKKSHFRFNLGPVLSLGLSSSMDFSGRTNTESLYEYSVSQGYVSLRPIGGPYPSHLNYKGKMDMYADNATLRWYTSDGSNGGNTEPSTFDASAYKRLNFGARIGFAYEYMGISLTLSYQLMLSNMANKAYWDSDRWKVFRNASELMTGYTQHNNYLKLSIGYTFRY